MRALSGANKVVGYALSMLLLAIASLVAIPAMIRASGEAAWGSVALGQAMGTVSAVAVAFGWSMSGPAQVARGNATARLAEYRASLKVRIVLFLPMAFVAATVAALLAVERRDLAVAGAVTLTMVGLTANWFFVGLARPYVFLLVETVPRVLGTAVGIIAMTRGQDAFVGLACQAAGFFVAFLCSTLWITRHLRVAGAERTVPERIPSLIRNRGDGLVASLGAAGYVAAPLMIVTVVAPGVLPTYALVDKLQRQVSVGLNPVITVLQGWVPRAADPGGRARSAVVAGTAAALLLGAGVLLVSPFLLGWLGAGSVRPSGTARLLMSIFVAFNFLESVVAKTVLATYGRLGSVARATIVGAAIGLPLVPVGALLAGAEGALAAVVLGLGIRLVWEVGVVVKLLRRRGRNDEQEGE